MWLDQSMKHLKRTHLPIIISISLPADGALCV